MDIKPKLQSDPSSQPNSTFDDFIDFEIDNERQTQQRLKLWVLGGLALAILGWWVLASSTPTPLGWLDYQVVKRPGVEAMIECSKKNFLSKVENGPATLPPPPPLNEYILRRNNLARALIEDAVDAYVLEPGYAMIYYANTSQTDWEPWEPEERPFVMIMLPDISPSGEIIAKTRFLAPSFEVERVRLLGMPFPEGRDVEVLGWEEHWDPYSYLLKQWKYGNTSTSNISDTVRRPKIMVDDEMRDFIQRGLSGAGFDVVGLAGEVERVRQTKTEVEIELLREVNTRTVEAVRATRGCLAEGLKESEVQTILDETLRAGGLEVFFDIVLFDENASNPHGGTNGSKTLAAETLILIDVGAHLHHYSSDICRTFFSPFLPKPSHPSLLPPPLHKKLKIWDLVSTAQTASLTALIPNNTAASVDIAARTVISEAGYGKFFTHRVGHGIGIKAHESPYLHKGNIKDRLRNDMCFTSEPGVYLVGEFGVRTEDVFLVRDGEPLCLSGRRALGPWDP